MVQGQHNHEQKNSKGWDYFNPFDNFLVNAAADKNGDDGGERKVSRDANGGGREVLEALKDVEDDFLKAYECGVKFCKMLESNNDFPVSKASLPCYIATILIPISEIRPILPQLLDEFFKLMNEVENEDLVFTLETIVDKFGEEMTPYALGLYQNLAAAFWKCMNSTEADDEAGDPGALAAVGCLRAISTILESVSRLPHLFAHIEPILLPIMRRMLTTDGQGAAERQ